MMQNILANNEMAGDTVQGPPWKIIYQDGC